MSKRPSSQKIEKNSAKRQITDIEAIVIYPILDSHPLSDNNLRFIFECGNPSKVFLDTLYDCMENNYALRMVFFKKYFDYNSGIHEDFYTKKSILSYLKNKNKQEQLNFLTWFTNFLNENRIDSNYQYGIIYFCSIIGYFLKTVRNNFCNLFQNDLEKILENNDQHILNFFDNINIEITYPYLYLKYFYNSEDYISEIALKYLNQEEFKKLFFKFGNIFFIQAISSISENYIRRNNKWTWKPNITNELYEEILNSVDSIFYLNKYIKSGFLKIEDAFKLARLKVIRLEDEEQYYDIFVQIFKNTDTLFGKYARFIENNNFDNYFDVFSNESEFSIAEKIKLINTIVPINIELFEKIEEVQVFDAALNNVDWIEMDYIIDIFNENYCENLKVSIHQFKDIICNFLRRKLNENNEINLFHYLLSPIFNRSLYLLDPIKLQGIYFFSDFIVENKQYCLLNRSNFNYYIAANIVSGRELNIYFDEINFDHQGLIFDENIIDLIQKLKNSGIYIYLTKKIYWKFNNTILYMNPIKLTRIMPDNFFTGINKIWNQLNTLLNNLNNIQISMKYIFKIVGVINQYEYETEVDKHIFANLFLMIYDNSKKYNNSLAKDVITFMKKENKEILISNIRSKYYVHYLLSSIMDKKVISDVEINVRRFIRDPDNKKNREFLLIEEYQKKYMKECAICMGYSKNIIKLNCSCTYDFCCTCISKMRSEGRKNVINCPTCRNTSFPYQDRLILPINYNKLFAICDCNRVVAHFPSIFPLKNCLIFLGFANTALII